MRVYKKGENSKNHVSMLSLIRTFKDFKENIHHITQIKMYEKKEN